MAGRFHLALLAGLLFVATCRADSEPLTWLQSAELCLGTEQKAFCSQSGSCVPLDAPCPAEEEKKICPQGTAFCAETGACQSGLGWNCFSTIGCASTQQYCQTMNFCSETMHDGCSEADPINLQRQWEAIQVKQQDNGDCKNIERVYDQCVNIEEKCKLILTTANEPQPTPVFPRDHCPQGSRYCPLAAQCILPEESCQFPRSAVQVDAAPPESEQMICPSDEYFCIGTQQCQSQTVDCLPDGMLSKLASDADVSCPDGNFCPFTDNCTSAARSCDKDLFAKTIEHSNCTSGERLCLAQRKCLGVQEFCDVAPKVAGLFNRTCRRDEKFCHRRMACIKNTESCLNQTYRVFDEVEDPTQWMTACSLRHVICPWSFKNMIAKDAHCPSTKAILKPSVNLTVTPMQNVTVRPVCVLPSTGPIRSCFGSSPVTHIAIVAVSNTYGKLKVTQGNDVTVVSALGHSFDRALVIGRNANLRFEADSPLVHGAVVIRYVPLEEGDHMTYVSLSANQETFQLVEVILPQVLSPILLSTNIRSLEISEDETHPRGFKVSHAVQMLERKPSPESMLPGYIQPHLSSSLLLSYMIALDEANSATFEIAIGKAEGSQQGTWQKQSTSSLRHRRFLQPDSQQGVDWVNFPRTVGLHRPYAVAKDDVIRFVPNTNTHGIFAVHLYGQVKSYRLRPEQGPMHAVQRVKFSLPFVTFTVDVINTNDAPVLTSHECSLPPVPYDVDENDGFNVSEVTTVTVRHTSSRHHQGATERYQTQNQLVSDPDGTVNGIAIIDTPSSSIGRWQFKMPGQRAWEDLLIRNLRIAAGATLQAMLLPPEARLKFVPLSIRRYWSRREAMYGASITFLAWDGSDQRRRGQGSVVVTSTTIGSISSTWTKGVITRRGCDGREDSMATYDACGICGGNGQSCKRCDGSTDSDAVRDDCDQCTRGNTGLEFNYLKDCSGQCSSGARVDGCGVCQSAGNQETPRDCNGVCDGKAEHNKCDICVLGRTGLPANSGMDICGVCGGDGTSCQSCVSSGNICNFELVSFEPRLVPFGQPFALRVLGRGDAEGHAATCYGEDVTTSRKIELGQSEAINTTQEMTVKFAVSVTPLPPVGTYNVSCKIGPSQKEFYFSQIIVLIVYDKDIIVINNAIPNVIATDEPSKIMLQGEKIINSSELRCVSRPDSQLAPARFISTSAVECSFSRIAANTEAVVSLLISSFEYEDEVVPSQRSQTIQLQCKSPRVARVRTMRNGRRLRLYFTKPIRVPHDARTDCNHFLTAATIEQVGVIACRMRTPRQLQLRIRRTDSPRSLIREQLQIRPEALQCRSNATTLPANNGSTEVNYNETDSVVWPIAVIQGPTNLRPCRSVLLSGLHSQGGMGRRMRFSWFVQKASTVGPVIQSVMESTRPLLRIRGQDLQANEMYKVMLCVTNAFEKTNCTSRMMMVDTTTSLTIDIGKRKIVRPAARSLRRRAKVYTSSCDKLSPDVAACIWDIEPHIELKNKDRRIVRIKRGTMQAGMTYNLTVTCSVNGDMARAVSSYVIIAATGINVRARISGGRVHIVSCTGQLTLNGSKSFDPDKSSDTEHYTWQCINNGSVCIKPRTDLLQIVERVVFAKEMVLQFPVADYLQCNQRYTITLTYTKGNRSDSTNVTVITKEMDATQISLGPVTTKPDSDVISVRAKLTTTADTSLRWHFVEGEEYGIATLEDVVTDSFKWQPKNITVPSQMSMKRAVVHLHLNRSALLPSTVYLLALNALTNGVVYSNEIEIELNGKPTMGEFTISPSLGIALDTDFTLDASTGWEDEDTPLSYTFGYILMKNDKQLVIPLTGSTEEAVLDGVQLPAGSGPDSMLTLYVDVKDSEEQLTRTTVRVSVNDRSLETDDVNAARKKANELLDEEEYVASLGGLVSLLETAESTAKSEDEETVREFKEEVAQKALDMLLEAKEAGQTVLRQATFNALYLITANNNNLKEQSKESVALTVSDFVASTDSNKEKDHVIIALPVLRQRRESPPMIIPLPIYEPEWEPLTFEEMEHILHIYDNAINTLDFDTTSLEVKGNLTASIAALLRSLCYNMLPGAMPKSISSRHIVLKADLTSFDAIDMTPIEIDTHGLSDGPVSVLLGTTLTEWFTAWHCDHDRLFPCTEVYLATAVMDSILFTRDEFGPIHVVSPVVQLAMVNPSSYAIIKTDHGERDIVVSLPMTEMLNLTTHECAKWDQSAMKWDRSQCSIRQGSNGPAECACYGLGVVAIIREEVTTTETIEPDGIIIIIPVTTTAPSTKGSTTGTTMPTTQPPTTSMPETTTTPTEMPQVPLNFTVEFSFEVDYDTYVGKYGVVQLKDSITDSFGEESIGIHNDVMRYIQLSKGSIIVMVLLVSNDNYPGNNLTTAVLLLQQMINDGHFIVTLPDDSTMTAQPLGSMTPLAAVQDGNGAKKCAITVVIVLFLVCVCVFVGVVYYKKHRRAKVLPEEFRVDMPPTKGKSYSMELTKHNNKIMATVD